MTSKKSGEMPDLIPNEAGLPCNEKDSPKVSKGLKEWKAIRKEKITPKGEELSYWKKKSSFPAL